METMHIVAHISSPISIQGWLPMDSLLMALEAQRLRLPPPEIAEGDLDVPIPLKRHERGFYHASFGKGKAHTGSDDQMWRRRRFPLRTGYLAGNEKVKKVPINMGPLKSINLPTYTQIVPKIEWWATGDLEWVRETLQHCLSLGKMRGSGFGRVAKWEVFPCEKDHSLWYPCDDPSVILPSRALPADLPEVHSKICDLQYTTLTPPYWQVERAELCAVPEAIG